MKVYISGKIGEAVVSAATRQKFLRAEGMLRAKGYEPFNPCSEEWDAHLRKRHKVDAKYHQPYVEGGVVPPFYTYALLRDLMALCMKDAIYFFADWKKSPGATAEYHFAKAIGMRMFFADRFDACGYLVKRMYHEVAAGNPPGEYLELERSHAEIAYAERHIDEAWLPL